MTASIPSRGSRTAHGRAWPLVACLLLAAGPASAQDATARRSAAELLPGLPQQVVDDACREGALTLYNSIYRNGAAGVLELFRKRFPCLSVTTYVSTGGGLTQRYTSEFRAGNSPADIVTNASPSVGDAFAADGMLTQWEPPTADRVPARWQNKGYWYAIGVEELGVAWNTDALSAEQRRWVDGFRRWEQLPSAPFKGSAALVDIRAGGSAQLPFAYFRRVLGEGFLKGLAELRPSVFNGINPLMDRLAAGEFDLCLVGLVTTFSTQKLAGAPVAWTVPEPGLAFPNFVMIAAKAPHPNAAKLYVTWSLSPEGQLAWSKFTGLSPANPDVRLAPGDSTGQAAPLPATLYSPDWKAIAAGLPDDSAAFARLFGR